jgi:hypothetical protein
MENKEKPKLALPLSTPMVYTPRAHNRHVLLSSAFSLSSRPQHQHEEVTVLSYSPSRFISFLKGCEIDPYGVRIMLMETSTLSPLGHN